MKNESQAYPRFKIGYVFSIGVPRQRGANAFVRDGNNVTLESPVGQLLKYYDGKADSLMSKIQKEIETYDDIILADYEDTYFNLTWKTVSNLRWLSAFCNKSYDFYMIIDDDHRMNLSQVHLFKVMTPVKKLRTSIHGRIAFGDGAFRSPKSKLFLSYNEVPWPIMCPYPRGFAQFIGTDVIDDMAIGSAYTRYDYIHEDVYLGLLAFKLQIPLIHLNGMYDHWEYDRVDKSKRPMVALKTYFGVR